MLSRSIIKFRIFRSFNIFLYPLCFHRFSNNNISCSLFLWLIKINRWWSNNCCSWLSNSFNSSTCDYWLNNWLIVIKSNWFLTNNCACSWSLINYIWCVIVNSWRFNNLSSDLITIWITITVVVSWIVSLSCCLAVVSSIKLWSDCLSLNNSNICWLIYNICSSISWCNWLSLTNKCSLGLSCDSSIIIIKWITLVEDKNFLKSWNWQVVLTLVN